MNHILWLILLNGCSVLSHSQTNESILVNSNFKNRQGKIAIEKWKEFFKPILSWEDYKSAETNLRSNVYARTESGWLSRARDEIVLGNFDAGERSLKEGILQNEPHSELLLELAMLYLQQKKLNDAMRTLSEIKETIDELGTDTEVTYIYRYQYVLALALLQKGSTEKGRNILKDLLAWDQSFIYGCTALADSYRKDGSHKLAKFILNKGLERAGEHPAILSALGRLSEDLKQEEDASIWYDRALSKSSDFMEALVGRARVWLNQGRVDLAQNLLIRVLQLRPYHVAALTLLGSSYEKIGRNEDAKLHYEKSILLDFENVEARFLLANLLFKLGKEKETAIRLFYEVKELETADQSIRDKADAMILNLQQNTHKAKRNGLVSG